MDADRLMELWPNTKKIAELWNRLPKSRRPGSKSYNAVLAGLEDPLTTAELIFFSYLSSLLEPYLKKYQTGKPTVSSMYQDLKILIKSLLKLITKFSVIGKCKSGAQIAGLDLSDLSILLDAKNIKMGFAMEEIVQKLIRKDLVTNHQLSNFQKEARALVVSILSKLLQKSPRSPLFVQCVTIFDPNVVASVSTTVRAKQFKAVLSYLMESKILSAKDCDKATGEFNKFCEEELKKLNEEFKTFNQSTQNLDDFYFKKLESKSAPQYHLL